MMSCRESQRGNFCQHCKFFHQLPNRFVVTGIQSPCEMMSQPISFHCDDNTNYYAQQIKFSDVISSSDVPRWIAVIAHFDGILPEQPMPN